MQIKNYELIRRDIINNNYKKNCSIYCCIPLYFTKFIFDLGFFSNPTEYAQTLFCGFNNNHQSIK
jgi:hypothetical protein